MMKINFYLGFKKKIDLEVRKDIVKNLYQQSDLGQIPYVSICKAGGFFSLIFSFPSAV